MSVADKVAEFVEDDDVVSLQFSPDSQQLAVSTGSTLHIHLWDWQKSHIERTLMKPLPADLLLSSDGLRYSPDGQMLAVAHAIASEADGRSVVDIFNPKTGAVVHRIAEQPLGGAYSRIEFSPDGKFLIRTFDSDSRSKTGQFMVHRADNWEVIWSLHTLPLQIQTLALTRDGKFAAVSGYTAGPGIPNRAQILIVDLERRKIVRTLDNIFPLQTAATVVTWHPDQIQIAVGSDGVGRGFEPKFPPEPVKIISTSTEEVVAAEAARPAAVTGLRYTSDGKYLIETGYPGMARIWDGQHHQRLQQISVK